jgi:hypothetical protein
VQRVATQRFGRYWGKSGHRADAVNVSLVDPQRHFASTNYRIAKELLDHLARRKRLFDGCDFRVDRNVMANPVFSDLSKITESLVPSGFLAT